MKQLPVAARVYVIAVIAVGLALLLLCLPLVRFDQPLLFLALLILSTLSTVLKVTLPLTTGGSTMSVSYAVDLAALLLLGPHETMLIAVAGGLGQCNLRSRERNPRTERSSAWRRSSSRCRARASRRSFSAAPHRRCRCGRWRGRSSASRRRTSC